MRVRRRGKFKELALEEYEAEAAVKMTELFHGNNLMQEEERSYTTAIALLMNLERSGWKELQNKGNKLFYLSLVRQALSCPGGSTNPASDHLWHACFDTSLSYKSVFFDFLINQYGMCLTDEKIALPTASVSQGTPEDALLYLLQRLEGDGSKDLCVRAILNDIQCKTQVYHVYGRSPRPNVDPTVVAQSYGRLLDHLSTVTIQDIVRAGFNAVGFTKGMMLAISVQWPRIFSQCKLESAAQIADLMATAEVNPYYYFELCHLEKSIDWTELLNSLCQNYAGNDNNWYNWGDSKFYPFAPFLEFCLERGASADGVPDTTDLARPLWLIIFRSRLKFNDDCNVMPDAEECVLLLLEHGATVNLYDAEGTRLSDCVYQGFYNATGTKSGVVSRRTVTAEQVAIFDQILAHLDEYSSRWKPSEHKRFPKKFRERVFQFLLINQRTDDTHTKLTPDLRKYVIQLLAGMDVDYIEAALGSLPILRLVQACLFHEFSFSKITQTMRQHTPDLDDVKQALMQMFRENQVPLRMHQLSTDSYRYGIGRPRLLTICMILCDAKEIEGMCSQLLGMEASVLPDLSEARLLAVVQDKHQFAFRASRVESFLELPPESRRRLAVQPPATKRRKRGRRG